MSMSEDGARPRDDVAGFLRETPLVHELCAEYAALRAIRTRKKLLQSDLWARLGPEIERVTTGVERADHAAARGPREPSRLRVCAWNVQRGARFDALLGSLTGDAVLSAADVLLLVEVDHGMARSGNRNVARELAARLGMSYAFGASYLALEDDFGENPDGRENTLALAGSAILSRVPLGRVENVDLPELRDKFSSSEKRLGKKRALAAELLLPGGATMAVSTCHLDSNASPRGRARQLDALLRGEIARSAPRLLVGGDFNTHTYDTGSAWGLAVDCLHKLLFTGFSATVDNYLTPDRRYETAVFATLAAHGLATGGWNDRAQGSTLYDLQHPYAVEIVRKKVGRLLTRLLQRLLRPWGCVVPARIDWFAARGLTPIAATTVPPARDATGAPVSDHAAIVADVALD